MKQFIVGILVGSALTASVGLAGNFYGKDGNVQAPTRSQQSFDYFRARQFFLDAAALRRNAEEQARQNRLAPCGRP